MSVELLQDTQTVAGVPDPGSLVTVRERRWVVEAVKLSGLPAQASYPFLTAGGGSVSARLDGGHSVSGNPMRFTTGQVPISRDEKWRTHMPRAQQLAARAPIARSTRARADGAFR